MELNGRVSLLAIRYGAMLRDRIAQINMTILETFKQIPVMFYFSLFFLPVALYGYLAFSKPKKRQAAVSANPADTLKEKRLDMKRESIMVICLGATLALGAGLLISISWLVGDYKNSRNLFAESLPAASFPPASLDIFPPAPAGEPINAASGK